MSFITLHNRKLLLPLFGLISSCFTLLIGLYLIFVPTPAFFADLILQQNQTDNILSAIALSPYDQGLWQRLSAEAGHLSLAYTELFPSMPVLFDRLDLYLPFTKSFFFAGHLLIIISMLVGIFYFFALQSLFLKTLNPDQLKPSNDAHLSLAQRLAHVKFWHFFYSPHDAVLLPSGLSRMAIISFLVCSLCCVLFLSFVPHTIWAQTDLTAFQKWLEPVLGDFTLQPDPKWHFRLWLLACSFITASCFMICQYMAHLGSATHKVGLISLLICAGLMIFYGFSLTHRAFTFSPSFLTDWHIMGFGFAILSWSALLTEFFLYSLKRSGLLKTFALINIASILIFPHLLMLWLHSPYFHYILWVGVAIFGYSTGILYKSKQKRYII